MKDQWHITDDPLLLQAGDIDMQVGLGAEERLAAAKNHQLIAVEVKSFLSPSPVYDFHLARGQFLNYRLARATQDPQRKLYLAIPIETYTTFFIMSFIQRAVEYNQLALIVYDSEHQEIVQWIH